MKKFFKFIGILAGLAVLAVIVTIALIPWMDRWGATDDEIAASLPGDELIPSPRVVYNRVVTVDATPEEIYPWIVQLGAERGGMYSYSWFETNILRCELINADRIHEEWQGLKVGDKVKMCPRDGWGPPPYEVGLIEPNKALVMGHQENGIWGDVWQFILVPQNDGTTRLILRGRDMKAGGFWDIIRPGVFIMERGMLLGIKERAEGMGPAQSVSTTKTVSISEFGRNISLSYDHKLASNVGTGTIPSVPLSDQVMFAESHPAYAQFRFNGFQNGGPYHLPILSSENRVPQVMIFQTADFPGYGEDSPKGFVRQSQALAELLQKDMDADHCMRPFTDNESALPFLPWINEQQLLCCKDSMS